MKERMKLSKLHQIEKLLSLVAFERVAENKIGSDSSLREEIAKMKKHIKDLQALCKQVETLDKNHLDSPRLKKITEEMRLINAHLENAVYADTLGY